MLAAMGPIRCTLCVALVAALIAATPASAQESAATIELLAQPIWHGADDELDIKLRITNTGEGELQGFNVVVGSSYRETTRSGLHTTFEPDSFEPVSSLPLPLPFPGSLGPGEGRIIKVTNRVSDLALVAQGEPGVYPVKITLQDSAGVSLDSIATQILFYPERPETRLGMVPVLALNDIPARSPDGTFGLDVDGRYPLEDALSDDGWLTAVVTALDRGARGRLRAGFAPTPRLLEELEDIADGYARVEGDVRRRVPEDAGVARRAAELLTQLRQAVASQALQPIAVPYSAPDLPTIAPVPAAVSDQLDAGAAAAEEVLGDDLAGGRVWAYAPSGRLDADALDQLSGAGVRRTFFSTLSLEPPPDPEAGGCPEPAFSFACPIEVATELGGSLTGYAFDPFVQDHLGEVQRASSPALALQRFFAETAMIREELPGTPERVIAAALPLSSRTPTRMSVRLIRGLTRAPWLDTMTPGRGLETSSEPQPKEIVSELPSLPDAPPQTYFATTQSAGDTVAEFGSIRPPATLTHRLGRNVLVAQGRALWTDLERGLDYATESVEEVEEEFAKIRVIGPEQITLTSKRGEFQFIVVNETGYDVTVDVDLDSPALDLPESGIREVPPGQEAITIDVITEASGIHPLNVQLRTPDGLAINSVTRITVRSTQFNEIALAITFGALAFVIIFYAVRGLRRRRNRRQPRPGTSAA